ncbi:MAG TPA: CRISPR-associated endonuclease Cas1 [Bacteroidetes bacterium]|nr:CRISPR-associated endonuclease Cas1 [Bacteroidota bacterium]
MQLVINTYGTYVHVKDQMFEVIIKKEGQADKHYFSVKKIQSIFLNKGTALSTDAIIMAIKNNIDIVVSENDGVPVGRFWHSRPGSTTKIRKKQLEASLNKLAVYWVAKWLDIKTGNQIEFLKKLKKHRKTKADFIQNAIQQIETLKEKFNNAKADNITEVEGSFRGWEGTSGRIYFKTLSALLSSQYQFNGRSFRPALDPFNAFLNYGYGILYSRVEKALVIAGLDPYTGFMHRDDYNTKSLVFDFIEPYRIIAEEVVFKLFSAKKVNSSQFDEMAKGYMLNKTGKAIMVEKFFKFFEEEKIKYKGRNQSRSNALQMDAHDFANSLIK